MLRNCAGNVIVMPQPVRILDRGVAERLRDEEASVTTIMQVLMAVLADGVMQSVGVRQRSFVSEVEGYFERPRGPRRPATGRIPA
jgi:hypothetical protein